MIHKLANGPLTLTVSGLESVEGQFGAQTQIDGEDAHGQEVRVFVSEMTAMRQLARLNLTPETVLGRTLTLAQVKKDGKTFTDFTLARPGQASAAAAPAAAAAAPRKVELADVVPVYRECVMAALLTLGDACEARGIPFDAAAIQSAAATLFIRVMR
jgi:hypothetical protein